MRNDITPDGLSALSDDAFDVLHWEWSQAACAGMNPRWFGFTSWDEILDLCDAEYLRRFGHEVKVAPDVLRALMQTLS